MKTNIYLGIIITVATVLYLTGTAVQFYNHSTIGIVGFVGGGAFFLGFLTGLWSKKLDLRSN